MKVPMVSKIFLRPHSSLTPFQTVIVLIGMSHISSVYSDCPKICSVCLRSTLICENSGFLEFPSKFQSSIENITMVGHHFTSNIISPANMTGLRSLKVRYLAIRSSSIQEISGETFSGLYSLQTLDLSENQILKINDFAFDGLNLHTLKLNEIGKLNFSSNSFAKLRVQILSIVNSRLRDLDYEVFHQIDPSTFRSFQISFNNFRTIDPRFEGMFSRLLHINLLGNPFVCNCSLLWLKRLSLQISRNQLEITFPKCVSPGFLRNRNLSEISESEFKCRPPKISEIGINFLSPFVADLTCQVETFKTKTHHTDVRWVVNINDVTTTKVQSQDIAYLRVKKSEYKPFEYKCVAENNVGKSSLIVFLDWPSSTKVFSSNLSFPVDYSATMDSFPWHTSFYFKRRYTLVELIVAVITSFTGTVLLFIITYRLCIQNSACPAFSKKSKLGHQKIVSQRKFIVPRYPLSRNNYGVDNALHSVDSNSQTYDCISISNAVFPHQIMGHSPNTLPGQFIDYKTHERLYTTQLDQ